MLIVLLLGCSQDQMDDCVTSSGPDTTIERQLEDFTVLETGDKFEVLLIQDSSAADIVITGPQNLLGQIESEVENGVLRLKNRNTCNFVRSFDRKIQIVVNVPDLERLIVTAASTVKTTSKIALSRLNILHQALSDINLEVDVAGEIYIQSYNSSSTVLRGQAGVLKGSIEDVSDLDARALLADEILIDTHTPLDLFVNARDVLFVKIFNKGNIYYVAEPSRYKELNLRWGKGDLIKL